MPLSNGKNPELNSRGNTPEHFTRLSQKDYIQQVSVECVIFGYQKKELKVLLPKLDFEGEFWALPSGFVFQNESINQAALRVLEDRTGIADIYLEQFQIFGNPDRNSRSFMEELISRNPEKLGAGRYNQKDFEWFTKRFPKLSSFYNRRNS